MTARTPIASTVPEPHGKPGGPGAFHIKGAMFPPYFEHVAGELLKQPGKTKSQAYRMAIGIIRNWKDGHDGHGHKVSAQVQAAAAKAWAQYLALRARAKAIPNKGHNLSRVDLAGPFDPKKHPRAAKGQSNGGRFVPLGSARNSQAAKAQKATGARREYRDALTTTGAGRIAQLRAMSIQQLAKLSRAAYSFKSSDPAVVKLRIAVAGEMARRGYDVKDFGALGGGIDSDKKLPPTKRVSTVKAGKKTLKARKRRSAARSAAATAKKAVSMSNEQTAGVDLATLTANQRKNLAPSQFAIPGQMAYPIPDRAHALAALARVAQFGTPAEKAAVRAAVLKRFPQLGKKASK